MAPTGAAPGWGAATPPGVAVTAAPVAGAPPASGATVERGAPPGTFVRALAAAALVRAARARRMISARFDRAAGSGVGSCSEDAFCAQAPAQARQRRIEAVFTVISKFVAPDRRREWGLWKKPPRCEARGPRCGRPLARRFAAGVASWREPRGVSGSWPPA